MQKDISGLINEILEKTCIFHFKEADGIGLILALIAMTKLRTHLDFLDEAQANELVERFQKKKRGKIVGPHT